MFPCKLQMIRLFCSLLIALCGAGSNPPAAADTPYQRGVNHGDYLAYPQQEAWPIFHGPLAEMGDDEFKRLVRAGFDFVRLPVEPGPFMDRNAEEVAALEARLQDFVRRANRAGLKVIVTGWPRHEAPPPWQPAAIMADREGTAYRGYLAFLFQLAGLLEEFSAPMIALQLMNEPQQVCWKGPGSDWTVFQREMYTALRARWPRLTLVLTTGCWSRAEALRHLDLSGMDEKTLIDIHYYEPWKFTHQGSTWTLPWMRYLAGLRFPPSLTDLGEAQQASGRLFVSRGSGDAVDVLAEATRQMEQYIRDNHDFAAIERDMDRIAQWAEQHGVGPERILIGEFGVIRAPPEAGIADDSGRMVWLDGVRRAAEARRFGWAVYAYHSDFGLVLDAEQKRWDDEMLRALGLNAQP